jgi:aldehyde dehydrogenase (NAD(P)+)
MTVAPTRTNPELDEALERLRQAALRWQRESLAAKRHLLSESRSTVGAIAREWVERSCNAKGLAPDDPRVGEEWMSGPWAVLSYLGALEQTIAEVERGRSPVAGLTTRPVPGGRTAVRVMPHDAYERILLHGFSAEIWLQPGVLAADAGAVSEHTLKFPGDAGVALVLGAGNVSSIPALDVLHKLYADGHVVVLKTSPVNDYLVPILTEALRPFVDRGYLWVTGGGAEAGSHLVAHAKVDTVHITGSARTHDAIVFGSGEEGAARKRRDQPVLDKPITSELGGVSAAVVLPGPWDDRDLRFQAENLVTQKLYNNGYTCISTQIVVLPQKWDGSAALSTELARTLSEAPARDAYYPGSDGRVALACEASSDVENVGGGRVLLRDLPFGDGPEPFHEEYFAPVLGTTSAPGQSASDVLDAAVNFCNEVMDGTLGMTIIAHPTTLRELGRARLDEAIARLRYGSVGINVWTGIGFLLARGAWGAFPGHTRNEVGSGIGVVHNALLLGGTERTVLSGPFRPMPRSFLSREFALSPKPPWFFSKRSAAQVGERLTRLAEQPSPSKLLKVLSAAMRA